MMHTIEIGVPIWDEKITVPVHVKETEQGLVVSINSAEKNKLLRELVSGLIQKATKEFENMTNGNLSKWTSK